MRLDARLLVVLVSAVGFALGPPSAVAQEFPARPINLVIPFGPGGASDLTPIRK